MDSLTVSHCVSDEDINDSKHVHLSHTRTERDAHKT